MEQIINDFIKDAISQSLFIVLTLFLAVLLFILTDLFILKRNVEKYIVPIWPILLMSYWTLSHRVNVRLQNKFSRLLSKFQIKTGTNTVEWDKEKRKAFQQYLLSHQKSVSKDLQSLIIDLKKLDSDITLLNKIIGELFKKSKMIWPDFLLLMVPFMRQYPSISDLYMRVSSLKFSVERHSNLLLPYLDNYVYGKFDEESCKLIANYLPYFHGSNFRLTEGILQKFLDKNRRYIDDYYLPLSEYIELIDKNIKDTMDEINSGNVFSSIFKKDKLSWIEKEEIWS